MMWGFDLGYFAQTRLPVPTRQTGKAPKFENIFCALGAWHKEIPVFPTS
jgi:hypothetical protein